MRQGKTNIVWFHLYVESKKKTKQISKTKTDSETETKGMVTGRERMGGIGEKEKGNIVNNTVISPQ